MRALLSTMLLLAILVDSTANAGVLPHPGLPHGFAFTQIADLIKKLFEILLT